MRYEELVVNLSIPYQRESSVDIPSPPSCDMFHSYLSISRRALRHNVTTIRTRLSADTIVAVAVKSNAYGHGTKAVVTAIDDLVDRYLVDDSLELADVRPLTTKPIELLGYVAPRELARVVALQGVISVYDEVHARGCEEWARANGATVDAYLAIDLRFGREGISPDRAPELIRTLRASRSIRLLGIYGHFSCADNDPDLAHSRVQQELLASIVHATDCTGLETHLFASSGIWAFDDLGQFNRVVRPGLSLYGLWPSEALRTRAETKGYRLTPALSWHSQVVQVKTVPSNFPIGYGATFTSPHPMTIGLIPQGYGDGLPRSYANGGAVIVNGVRCPIVGRISMNMLTIDLTAAGSVTPGTPAVILGTQQGTTISAEDHAFVTDTISYEVTTRISPLLPRSLPDE